VGIFFGKGNNCINFKIKGVFEVEAFLLTCDSMRCSEEF
jgi:hypothetical protein